MPEQSDPVIMTKNGQNKMTKNLFITKLPLAINSCSTLNQNVTAGKYKQSTKSAVLTPSVQHLYNLVIHTAAGVTSCSQLQQNTTNFVLDGRFWLLTNLGVAVIGSIVDY